MIHYTADLHFHHANVIDFCDRPFLLDEFRNAKLNQDNSDEHKAHFNFIKNKAVTLMHSVLIDNINKLVMPDDTLKIIGDFSMSKNFDTIKKVRDSIACKNIHLILGNHDYLSIEDYKKIFQKVCVRDIDCINGQHIVCDHYGGRVWYNSHRGSFLLYGHSHGKLPPYGLSFDVGVDCWDFCPLSIEQITDIMKVKK